jgi:ATP-dependent Clp protease ATP-binding subunit ClpA
VLQHEILDPLALMLIENKVTEEQTVKVEAKDDEIKLKVSK